MHPIGGFAMQVACLCVCLHAPLWAQTAPSLSTATQVSTSTGPVLTASPELNSAAVKAPEQSASQPAPALPAPAPLKKPGLVAQETLNSADTTWMMTSTVLVLLMTLPGIALFYGGMVRKKNVINTMACVVAIAAVVSLLWFAVGYSLAFTPGNGFIGGLGRAGFSGMDYIKDTGKVAVSHIATNIPESVYSMFQLSFAIITAALVVGSLVERMRFSAMLIFISLWTVCVYAPIAHWVWEPGGWLAQMGVLDFAGGSVVHINAGVSGLVVAYFLGVRRGYGREPFEPFNLGLTMAGTGLLWVGWFGFNAGSAVAADGRAGLAMVVTHISACAGAIGWMAGEWIKRGRPSLLGLCSGAVAGLVSITPAAGFVTPPAALVFGIAAGLMCYWGATGLKRALRADDSLDVFGVHAVGGIVGSLLTGVFASKAISGVEGSLLTQALGISVVAIYSLLVTAVLLGITMLITALRPTESSELEGMDLSQHRERIGT
jgi:ammonium transporter, Amt family